MESMAEDMKEELTLMQRSVLVAGCLAARGWLADPNAAPFWDITGELRVLEIALRRRLWQVSGVPPSVPVDYEIAIMQDLIQSAKLRTELEVTKLRNT